jgi:hypothetical protein
MNDITPTDITPANDLSNQPDINIVLSNISANSINIVIREASRAVTTALTSDSQDGPGLKNITQKPKQKSGKKNSMNNIITGNVNNVQEGMNVPFENGSRGLPWALPVYANRQSLLEYNEWLQRQNQMRNSRQRRRL